MENVCDTVTLCRLLEDTPSNTTRRTAITPRDHIEQRKQLDLLMPRRTLKELYQKCIALIGTP